MHTFLQLFFTLKNKNILFLRKIVDKIDKNRDSLVNENELRNWIRLQHKTYLQTSRDKKWIKLNTNKDEILTFDELIENTIGQPDTCTPPPSLEI